MFNLERTERLILILLTVSLIFGLALIAYKKSHSGIDLQTRTFDIEREGPAFSQGDILKEKIDINQAGVEELMKLKGVGEVLAGRIIDYRDSNGRFTSVEEIKKVKGVGKALFEKIREAITV